jgi:hypothetical protein
MHTGKARINQYRVEKARASMESKSTHNVRYQQALRQEQCEPRLLFETHPNVTPNPTMLNAIECSKRRPRTLQHDSEGDADGEWCGRWHTLTVAHQHTFPVCATHTNMTPAHHYIRAHATSRPCGQEKQMKARNPMHERPPLTHHGLSPSQ